MKNGNKWIIAILGMAATAALAGCQSETSKAIDGLEDFVSVASYDDIHVFNSNITIDSRTLNGQKVTGTGNMEFADIVFGVVGFLLMFLVFALIRWIVGAIRKRLRKQKSGKSSPENQ